MLEVRNRYFLPALMGSLQQQKAEGELVLEQNDGTRRLYWAGGALKYLRSDAVGEQFGNFLIRRGVLDMASLKELLADGEGVRVGDRVVQWGLMTQEECDLRLHELLGSVLLHAMEHTIVKMTWIPEALGGSLSGDLQFRLDHRALVWDTFQQAKIDQELVAMFHSDPDWRWKALPNLLEALSDLPLTPTLAYALSLLGNEPLSCDTIESLTGLPREEATKLVATLWALGGLTLVQGELPLLPKAEPPPPQLPPPVLRAPEPELVITLVEDEPAEPLEVTQPEHSQNLMDYLELDAAPQGREFPSPAGPRPSVDPFAPAPAGRDPFGSGPTGRDPFAVATPPAARAPFQAPTPVHDPFSQPGAHGAAEMAHPPAAYPPPDFVVPTVDSLPMAPSDDDYPPVERARRLVVKAKSYLMQDRTSEAIRALEQALKLDGDSKGAYETWLLLGRTRLTNPAWSTRAIEALQVASRLNPRAAEPWALMGELYYRKGFQANAQGCFRRALELDPSVAVPAGWSTPAEAPTGGPTREPQSSLMGKLRGMFGREKDS